MGCAGGVAACLAAIAALVGLLAWLGEGDSAGGYARVRDPREFESAAEGGHYRLSFGFADHHGRVHRVACRVSHRDLEREVASFGFEERDLYTRLDRRVRERLEAEAELRDVRRWFRFRPQGKGGYRWEWRVPEGVREPERGRALAAAREMGRWIETAFPAEHRRIEAELLAEHGFRTGPDGLEIDYARLAVAATESVSDCQRALMRAGEGSSWRQYLGLFLGFYQSLRYEIPPVTEESRFQLGLWTPTQVLVKGRGDCDSKSVALTSMLRPLGRRIIFIVLPRHALIGVEMTPRPGEQYVRVGNRYFVLCDPAGEARIPPGGQAISGAYRYVLIEPE